MCEAMPERRSPLIIRIPFRPPRGGVDFPIRRREEADAVRHAREEQQAGAFGEAHQLLRQIERPPELLPARAFAAFRFQERAAFAPVGGNQRGLTGAARHPVRRGEIVRREALHDTGIGEEGFPALVIERLQLRQVLADTGDLHLVAAHEAEGVLKRREMAERGHFIDEQEGSQPARAIERAQRRDDDEAQPHGMRPHPFGGQDHIDRHRPILEPAKIHPRLFEVAAHGFRKNPARLRVGGRTDARELVRLFDEARGEAGDFIAAFGHHVGGGDAQAALGALAHLAVVAAVAFPCFGFGEHAADIFEIGARAVLALLPHEKRDEQALRRLRPMRVFALDLDERFAERRRVVVKVRRGGIEHIERIETGGAEAEHVEGIEHHHVADRAAKGRGDAGELALGIDDDDRTIADRQQVRNQEARPLAGTVRTEKEYMTLSFIDDLVAYALRRFVEMAAKAQAFILRHGAASVGKALIVEVPRLRLAARGQSRLLFRGGARRAVNVTGLRREAEAQRLDHHSGALQRGDRANAEGHHPCPCERAIQPRPARIPKEKRHDVARVKHQRAADGEGEAANREIAEPHRRGLAEVEDGENPAIGGGDRAKEITPLIVGRRHGRRFFARLIE